MRASFPVQALASVFAAAAIGTLSAGCSLGIDSPPPEEEEEIFLLPPILEVETPRSDLVYSLADDERPDLPGVQLRLRVRVNDLVNGVWLEDVALGVDGADKLERAPVIEDWRGERRAEIAFTVFPGEDIRDVTLVARAGGDLASLEQRIYIGPAASTSP